LTILSSNVLFAPSNRSNHSLFNSNVPLHLWSTQIRPFQLKWPSLLSNIYTYIQPTQLIHNASNMLSSITNTYCDTYNLQICICTPTILLSPNLQILNTKWCSKNMYQCTSNMKHPKGSSKPYNRLRSPNQLTIKSPIP
jgi:hypothetical protein